MKIRIISIGKVKQKFVKEGEHEYLKRLAPLSQVEILELPAQEYEGEEFRKKEAALLLGKRLEGEVLILLDETGKQCSSLELGQFLEQQMIQGRSKFLFAIGGAFGWPRSLLKEADLVLSLSRCTFPYQLCRLILVEQVYRAMTLIKGIPYHKG